MISYQTIRVALPKFPKRATSAWLRDVAAAHGCKIGDVAYVFCDDEKILEVNKTYLSHDYFTDIITFDYTEGELLGGDIFISLDTVRSNAELFGKTYDEELHRVMVHGILHLCGLQDKGPGQREAMEAAEDEALALLPTP